MRDGLHPPDGLLCLSQELVLQLLVHPQQRSLVVLQEELVGLLRLLHRRIKESLEVQEGPDAIVAVDAIVYVPCTYVHCCVENPSSTLGSQTTW